MDDWIMCACVRACVVLVFRPLRGSSLSRNAPTLFSPDTSTSSSEGFPSPSKANRDITLPLPLNLPLHGHAPKRLPQGRPRKATSSSPLWM